ncbi:MAG: hypothetical protein CVV21_02475 [Candidatus Goldiibacteriota bacterium HGW-Goldbacteria-1]|nr:MAG: hypothetical protein CVV21_02475 [Candidatus Goldiibacteriota bacterium HGW-Goldbacteria-1]
MEKFHYPAIRLKQFNTELYLTSLSAESVAYLVNQKSLIVDKYQRGEEDSYQRNEDHSKIRELADFLRLYKNDDIVKPILPASIIINVPDSSNLTFDEKNGQIILDKKAKLNIVDGQHRVKAVCKAYSDGIADDFEVPVTFIKGLKRIHEAAQFLIINVKQKQVRTDLTMTILHEMNVQTNQLATKLRKILKVDGWQIEATAIAIDVNTRQRSPWFNLIMRPNESKQSLKELGVKWVPIKQASFVDSLRRFCATNTSKTLEEKIAFLIKTWNYLKKEYAPSFDCETGNNYMLTKGTAIGPIHIFMSLMYSMETCGLYENIEEVMTTFVKKYPLEFWEKGSKHAGSWGTSQKEYYTHAKEISEVMFPELYSFWNSDLLEHYRKKDLVDDEVLNSIEHLMDPFSLKPYTEIEEYIKNDVSGIYLLINKKRNKLNMYVGQAESIKDRVAGHNRDFLAFNFITVNGEDLDTSEALVYHLINKEFRTNTIHPPTKKCEFCEHDKKHKSKKK